MKVLLINSVCGVGSTGRICADLAAKFEQDGHTVKIAYGRGNAPEQFKKYAVRIGSDMGNKLSALHTRLTDRHGFANKCATKSFLKWAQAYDPDILWLHNLHGYYINVEMLFDWIKSRPQMQVKWTLHDCWTFTGHCSHFVVAGCYKWQDGCDKCIQKKYYPSSILLDNSRDNYKRKKAAFTGVKNMTLITPSNWLAELVKQSFLSEYPVEIINNTIDTNIFKPTPSDFREKYGLQGKKVILGVSGIWTKNKGFYDFLKLSEMLKEDQRIVMVGLNDKQLKMMPQNIVGIKRTESVQQLAEIYSAADVFVNLTYSDTFPTVNLEARACGLNVITYRTGGSPESAGKNAIVVDVGDLESVYKEICRF